MRRGDPPAVTFGVFDPVLPLAVVLIRGLAEDRCATGLRVREVRVDVGDEHDDATGLRLGLVRRAQPARCRVQPDSPTLELDLTVHHGAIDLVETGRTLRENGLNIVEVIAESTARLVINRASYQLKADAVARLVDSINKVTDHGEKCD